MRGARFEKGTRAVSWLHNSRIPAAELIFRTAAFEDLRDAIRNKMFTPPDNAIVYPGQGPQTTIGRVKRSNPYVGMPSAYRG